ncbi:MAG: hypothetical protein L6266_05095 [Nanoarchaeota archaeon]|nr:hypothetical protein [Nanoarchaeota archaeon]
MKKIKKIPLLNLYVWLICLTIASLITYFIDFAWYWIHESGHILVGLIINLSKGVIPSINITNWLSFGVLYVPQQVKIIPNYTLIAFGGLILTILISTLISLKLYLVTKKKLYLVFPFLVLFLEFVSNFLYGTDNFQGYAYLTYYADFVNTLAASIFIISILILITFLIYQKYNLYFQKLLLKIINKLQKV